MPRRSTRNVRIKRRYLVWLKEAKGLSEASIDRAAASIDRFETATKGADFGALHSEKIRAFKRELERATNPATSRPLAAGTIDGTLRDLKAFFSWLADQSGYRSKVSHSDAAYFTSNRRLAKAAHGGAWVDHPSPDQVRHAIRLMPDGTTVQRRDRAVMAMLLLTGARDGALVTLRLANLNLEAGCVSFIGRHVETKFGKAFTTWFFPVGGDIQAIVADWAGELRRDHLFSQGDSLFPKQLVGLNEEGAFKGGRLAREPWSNAAAVSRICKAAFMAAGLPAYTPHLIRKTLVDLASEHCVTAEEFKAWSQNLGHEDVLTTFRSYGAVSNCRQREIMSRMSAESGLVEAP
ncbi:MAG: tyrosine-type recombinase/integrase [Pseudomonadota bacterium]